MIRILNCAEVSMQEIFARDNSGLDVSAPVREILEDVKARGDEAVKEYCARFDGAVPEPLEVTEQEMKEALTAVDPELLRILREAAENIRAFHSHQVTNSFILTREDGVVMGQKVMPIEKVGLYVPGGTAAYPSTVLMDAIPAKIAGCREIVMVTPAKGGKINPAILAAASVAGVNRIFKVGGAQAVGALAYGTESFPKVDKIVGPGNAYVAEAKRQVYGLVDIDMIAGPSEILVVADETAKARTVAADLLSQAEHDRNASAVLVTSSMSLARQVAEEIEAQLKELPREEIARASVEHNGKIIVAEDLSAAVEIANTIAPEHLELCVEDPFYWLGQIRNAGSVFMGHWCPESLGDYLAGPNHTLPTMGTARFSSPLSVEDFVKRTQFTCFNKEALRTVYKDIAVFARTEGLDAHARAAEIRFEGEQA